MTEPTTKEIIYPVDKDMASRLILMSMTAESKHQDLFKHFSINKIEGESVNVQVELKINGVQVNFRDTLTESFKRVSETFEANVRSVTTVSDDVILAKAKDLLNHSRLQKLEQIISEAEWKIEQELEKLMKDEK